MFNAKQYANVCMGPSSSRTGAHTEVRRRAVFGADELECFRHKLVFILSGQRLNHVELLLLFDRRGLDCAVLEIV